MDERYLLSPEVADALADGRPVVALESSIVAQGLPHPENLQVGQAMQEAVRSEGAVPAMTALLDGRFRIGLNYEDMTRLADDQNTLKCGSRDLGPAMARGLPGATTVSATVQLAAAAGIRVFGTGGIGGVHRALSGDEGAIRFDISADLMAMSRAPVAVVSSGAKSLLDLPTTLEALESLSIPVLGYGCDEFPAFYTAESGLPVSHRFDDFQALAAALLHHWGLPHTGGVLVCNPPPEELAMAADEVEALVNDANTAAAAAGISGAALTPFVLAHMRRASDDRTLHLNGALAVANASLAGSLAVYVGVANKTPG